MNKLKLDDALIALQDDELRSINGGSQQSYEMGKEFRKAVDNFILLTSILSPFW
ncbi:hypothetical protein [Dysgonomonas termitidis]|uniref:Bacteriocin n=1 Tax=Dysgonomonas termitidis TaxID=1516126 RepID=A0ABV9KVY5_9BACT